MSYEAPTPGDVPLVRRYVRVVLARRWLVLAVIVLIVGATALYTFTQPPVYQAMCQVLIEPKKPKAVSVGEVYETAGPGQEYYETQYRLLRDRRVAERVVEELDVVERPAYAGVEDPAAAIRQGICVEPIPKSRLVDVGFEHTDPRWSAQVANAVVEAYIAETRRRELTTARQALGELTRQAQELEPKFRACTAALQSFKERTDLVGVENPEGDANTTIRRLNRLNAAATGAELKRITLESEREAALRLLDEGGDLDSLPSVAGNEVLQQLKMARAEAERRRAALARRYLPKHPQMKVLTTEVEVLSERIRTERTRILAGLDIRYEQAREEETRLASLLADQRQEALKVSRLAMQYNVLKQEADRVGRLYDVVLERIKEIDLAAELADHGTNIFVVHEARSPETPVRPRKARNLLLASLAAVSLAIGLAFFLDHLDTTLKGKEDIEEALGLPVLGFVPAVRSGSASKADGANRVAAYLAGARDSRSNMAEAFRTIRTGITLSAASKKMKRLLVTSPLPGEGKTVVAVNTAAALAQGGAKVLLVDTDMRRPRVHKVFGVRPKTGLTSYLVSDAEGVRIEDVVTRTGQPNLDVLFCDQVPPNPAELLGSPRMESLIREASERYDRIVFDSPPTAVVADPSILSSKADGVVMVVRAFNTDRHVARRTKETLEGIANRVIGVVVNGVDAARHGAYHGYGYGYGYGRYYGRGKGGDDGGDGDALPHEDDGSLAADRVGAHDGDGNGNGDAERREESRQFRDLLMMAESDRR